jgi:hypothetical protein
MASLVQIKITKENFMSLAPYPKGVISNAIKIAILGSSMQLVHANSPDASREIEQLRAEVAELRALIQQQAAQHAAAVVAAPPPPKIDPKDLKLITQKGAEVKLYGFVRADATYTFEGNDTDFNRTAQTTNAARNKLRSTAQVSRLGFDFKTPVGAADQLGGKIEVDFSGGSSFDTFRLRQAYITYNKWLFGQTLSNFLSGDAPEMIDHGTPVGGGTTRVPQVRYSFNVAPSTKAFVALEEGDSSVTGSNVTLKYKLPVLTARVTQELANKKGLASVRGFVEQYDIDLSKVRVDEATAWGVSIGARYQLLPKLKVLADFSHVKGDSKYLYGSNAGATVVANQVEQNEFNALQVGATYQVSAKLRSTIGYGALFADDDTGYAASFSASSTSASANKEVRHAWINLVYSPVKPLDLALEYLDGERETFGGLKFNDNRLNLMARYNF